jgi:hypothetical protein
MRHQQIRLAFAVFLAVAVPSLAFAQQPVTQRPIARVQAAEAAARQLIEEFYDELDDRRGVRSLDACTAKSLMDCFGGDSECLMPASGELIHGSVCLEDKAKVERAALLARLDTLARAAPESDWIAGQRAYVALKAADSARATSASLDCGIGIWCQAVRGFVLHTLRPGSATAVFDSVLAAATGRTLAWGDPSARPAPRRGRDPVRYSPPPFLEDRGLACEWSDLTPVIANEWFSGLWSEKDADGSRGTSNGRTVEVSPEAQAFLSDYREGGCPNRSVETRFWWLADPFWSDTANERRDEHIARNVWRRLRSEIVTDPRPDRVEPAWQPASLVALGIPNSWGRGFRCGTPRVGQRSSCGAGTAQVTFSNPEGRAGQGEGRGGSLSGPPRAYVNGGYSFAPDAHRFYDPANTTAQDWALEWNVGSERMITKETWYNVDEQTAVLRRGARNDSLVVLVAGRLPLVVPSFQGITANLALGRPADLHVETTSARIEPSGVIRASATVGGAGWLTSLELGGSDWRARSRHGAVAPTLTNAFGISDPVLVDERFVKGSDVLASMLPGTTTSSRTIGIYLEVYGVEAGEALHFTLSAEAIKVDRSIISRIGSVFRLGSSGGLPQRVVWSQPAETEASGRMSHHLTLGLGDVADGEYRLVLRVERERGGFAVGSRTIQVAR